MVEKLSQRSTLVCPSPMHSINIYAELPILRSNLRLCPVHGIKCLVQEEPNCPSRINPSGHVLVKGRVVP